MLDPDSPPFRPTREQLEAARAGTLRDVIGDDLRVLFCGINPGLYTTAIGHHFGRPGNRFWPALHRSGFTPRLFSPFEDGRLLGLGLGVTNLCPRTTARADELSRAELRAGAADLEARVRRHRPRWLAMLGMTAYRDAFGRPGSAVGPQRGTIGATRVWLLPNPSGLNAHYRVEDLARAFAELRRVVDREGDRTIQDRRSTT